MPTLYGNAAGARLQDLNLERGRPEYEDLETPPTTWFGADWLVFFNWDSRPKEWVVGEPLTSTGETRDFFTNDRHHPGDSVILQPTMCSFYRLHLNPEANCSALHFPARQPSLRHS